MSSKTRKQPTVRKPSKKVSDSGRVRYGAGCAPARVVRSLDAATRDTNTVRFGAGCCPASLRK